jgi:hypothetical protein
MVLLMRNCRSRHGRARFEVDALADVVEAVNQPSTMVRDRESLEGVKGTIIVEVKPQRRHVIAHEGGASRDSC